MYPAEWAESKPTDPRAGYQKASATASLPPEELDRQYSFPPDTEPVSAEPTILLPPAETGNDLLFADLDDVIVDGEITAEAWEIIERLGGYAEVSRSFTHSEATESGAHVWVRGQLPDGYGKVIAELNDRGQLELYDRGRMTGCTWQHITGTPPDTIPDAQDEIDGLVEEYAREHPTPATDGSGATATPSQSPTRTGFTAKENAYFRLDITDVADTGKFSRYRTDPGNPAYDDWQGPHPSHGGTKTPDRKSTNFHVDPSGNCWHCFAHGSGGGALALIAVLENYTTCRTAQSAYTDRHTLLRTCLTARDAYARELDGETPPYDALIAVAELMDLSFADPDAEILGDISHNVAERVYADMEPSDVA
jgi:hypothetical protein